MIFFPAPFNFSHGKTDITQVNLEFASRTREPSEPFQRPRKLSQSPAESNPSSHHLIPRIDLLGPFSSPIALSFSLSNSLSHFISCSIPHHLSHTPSTISSI